MFDPLADTFDGASAHETSHLPRVGQTTCSVNMFPFLVRQQLRAPRIDSEAFCLLCKIAIGDGMVARKDLKERFGDAIPKGAEKAREKWPVPDPATMRDILTFFSTLDPETSSGSKLPWRHEQCAQPEAAQALPNLPRTAMGHRHS